MSKKSPRSRDANVYLKDGETYSQGLTRQSINPSFQAATTLTMLHSVDWTLRNSDCDFNDLLDNLEEQIATNLESGCLEESQRMLAAQAATLDGLFHMLTKQAAVEITKDFKLTEALLKLGLKAQSQSRSTVEALSGIKNPRIAHIVEQANIAGGHQQVNNDSRAKNEIPRNELLEELPSERMDTRAPSAAVRTDSGVEALGAVYRAKDARR